MRTADDASVVAADGVKPSAGPFTPIRPGSLVATVHGQIRRAVLSGEIQVGEEVRDSVLATQMNVSRAPVREALRLLEQSGLVQKTANKPYRVTRYDRDDLRELVVLRIALETTAARLVVAQQEDTGALREAMERMREAFRERSASGLDAADWQFHHALVQASGVRRLQAKYAELVDQIMLAWRLHSENTPRAAGSVPDHEALLETLEDCAARQDPAAVHQQLVDHIKCGMGCADLRI